MDNYNKDENSKKLDFEKLSEEFNSLIEEGRYGRLLSRVYGSAFKALWNCQWSLAFRLLIFADKILKALLFVPIIAILVLLVFLFLGVLLFREPSDFNKAKTAYETGDYKTAVEYYMKVAENDSVNRAVAFNRLGICYDSGEGVEQNDSVAVKYYRQSADLGYHWGEYNLGYCYYKGEGVKQDYVEAVRLFRLAAEENNASALSLLGLCYHFGQGVEENAAEAVKCYRKSAELGNLTAEFNLAWCYFHGQCVEQNYEEAVRLLKGLYKKNYDEADALQLLADCYYNGYGVEQDFKEALRLYCLAEEHGGSVAEEKDGCYRQLINVYIEEAKNDSVEAQMVLGDCYYAGRGVAKDYKEALKWYKLAAKNGSAEAYNNIGQCYLNGHGVKRDYAKAVIFFKEAISKGCHRGEYNLGYCYYYGFGVKQDMTKAKEYFKSAADKGNSQAKEMLKIMQDEK